MPQAKLPDVNSAIVKHRSYALICMESKNYSGATGSLSSINALMPADYKVEINSQKFKDLLRTKTFFVCTECHKEVIRSKLKILKLLNPIVVGTITNNQYQNVWICTECHKENKLLKTRIINETIAKPYYLKVVPEEPRFRDNLQTREAYHEHYKVWFYNFLEEIEYQVGLYRAEYLSQQDMFEVEVPPDDE